MFSRRGFLTRLGGCVAGGAVLSQVTLAAPAKADPPLTVQTYVPPPEYPPHGSYVLMRSGADLQRGDLLTLRPDGAAATVVPAKPGDSIFGMASAACDSTSAVWVVAVPDDGRRLAAVVRAKTRTDKDRLLCLGPDYTREGAYHYPRKVVAK